MKTTLLILELVALFFIAIYIISTYRYICKLRSDLKEARDENRRYHKSGLDCNPKYSFRRISGFERSIPEEYWGKYAVVRTSLVDGYYIHEAVIKVFADADKEFNKREAIELCEILNAK